MTWDELADGVFRKRYDDLLLNIGLVVGEAGALVVDTRASKAQAVELLDDVRRVTRLPVRWAVNTHWHWDHAFGNSELVGSTIWGHVECRRVLAERGDEARRQVGAREPHRAPDMDTVEIRLPDRVLTTEAAIDLGGRRVTVRHHGRGHTEGDVVVEVTGVCFAGDLLEQGAPPFFGDGYPIAWPATVRRILDGDSVAFVPGHGDVMDRGGVAAQLEDLAALAGLAIDSHREGVPVAAVDVVRSPYPAEVTAEAVARAYLELSGR